MDLMYQDLPSCMCCPSRIVLLDSCLIHYRTMTNNVVFNQDDAVAVTSGGDIVWDNSYCYGGHGASVGSVGLKSNNTVDGVIFSNTKIIASQNGARIKTNSGASGLVNNVTYSNIDVQDISIYGVSHPLGASRQMLMSPFLSGSLTFSKTTVSDN